MFQLVPMFQMFQRRIALWEDIFFIFFFNFYHERATIMVSVIVAAGGGERINFFLESKFL